MSAAIGVRRSTASSSVDAGRVITTSYGVAARPWPFTHVIDTESALDASAHGRLVPMPGSLRIIQDDSTR